MKLMGFEAKAITAWNSTSEDFDTLNFKDVASLSNIPLHNVRRAVRGLARKGLTEYARFTWTDDGEAYGAGYRITPLGRAALRDAEEGGE